MKKLVAHFQSGTGKQQTFLMLMIRDISLHREYIEAPLGIDGQGKHNYEYDKVLFHFVIKDMAEQHSFFLRITYRV